MKSTSLLIADKIDPTTRFVYDDIAKVAKTVGVNWLVVGATARDMIYHAALGLPIKRATADIDFAIQVDSWDTFTAITKSLVDDHGFSKSKSVHRLELPNSKLWIDGQRTLKRRFQYLDSRRHLIPLFPARFQTNLRLY